MASYRFKELDQLGGNAGSTSGAQGVDLRSGHLRAQLMQPALVQQRLAGTQQSQPASSSGALHGPFVSQAAAAQPPISQAWATSPYRASTWFNSPTRVPVPQTDISSQSHYPVRLPAQMPVHVHHHLESHGQEPAGARLSSADDGRMRRARVQQPAALSARRPDISGLDVVDGIHPQLLDLVAQHARLEMPLLQREGSQASSSKHGPASELVEREPSSSRPELSSSRPVMGQSNGLGQQHGDVIYGQSSQQELRTTQGDVDPRAQGIGSGSQVSSSTAVATFSQQPIVARGGRPAGATETSSGRQVPSLAAPATGATSKKRGSASPRRRQQAETKHRRDHDRQQELDELRQRVAAARGAHERAWSPGGHRPDLLLAAELSDGQDNLINHVDRQRSSVGQRTAQTRQLADKLRQRAAQRRVAADQEDRERWEALGADVAPLNAALSAAAGSVAELAAQRARSKSAGRSAASAAMPPATTAAAPTNRWPWRTNMRRASGPTALRRPLPEAEDHGWAPLDALEFVAAPSAGAEGSSTGRYRSPGPTRVRELDPAGQADLVAFMERRRAESVAREQQRRDAAEAPLRTRLRVLQEEMARTRQVARDFADRQERKAQQLSRGRPAWADPAQDFAGQQTTKAQKKLKAAAASRSQQAATYPAAASHSRSALLDAGWGTATEFDMERAADAWGQAREELDMLAETSDRGGAHVVRVPDAEYLQAGSSRQYKMHRQPGAQGAVGSMASVAGMPLGLQALSAGDPMSLDLHFGQAAATRDAVYGGGLRPGNAGPQEFLHVLRAAEKRAQAQVHSSSLSRSLYDGLPAAIIDEYAPRDPALVPGKKRKSAGAGRLTAPDPGATLGAALDNAPGANYITGAPRWPSPDLLRREVAGQGGLGGVQEQLSVGEMAAAAAQEVHRARGVHPQLDALRDLAKNIAARIQNVQSVMEQQQQQPLSASMLVSEQAPQDYHYPSEGGVSGTADRWMHMARASDDLDIVHTVPIVPDHRPAAVLPPASGSPGAAVLMKRPRLSLDELHIPVTTAPAASGASSDIHVPHARVPLLPVHPRQPVTLGRQPVPGAATATFLDPPLDSQTSSGGGAALARNHDYRGNEGGGYETGGYESTAGGAGQQPDNRATSARDLCGVHGQHGTHEADVGAGPHPAIRLVPRPRTAWPESTANVSADSGPGDTAGRRVTGEPSVAAASHQPVSQQQPGSTGRQRAPRTDTPPPQRPSPSDRRSGRYPTGRSPLSSQLLLAGQGGEGASALRNPGRDTAGDAYGVGNLAAHAATHQRGGSTLGRLAAEQAQRGTTSLEASRAAESLLWRSSPTASRQQQLPQPPSLASAVVLAQAGMSGYSNASMPGYSTSRLHAATGAAETGTAAFSVSPAGWEPEAIESLFGRGEAGMLGRDGRPQKAQRPAHEVALGLEDAAPAPGPPFHETLLGLGHSGVDGQASGARRGGVAATGQAALPAHIAAVGAGLSGPGAGPMGPRSRFGAADLGHQLHDMLQRYDDVTAVEIDFERLQQTRVAAAAQQSTGRIGLGIGSSLFPQRQWPYNTPEGSAPAVGVASAFVDQLQANRAAHDKGVQATSTAALTGVSISAPLPPPPYTSTATTAHSTHTASAGASAATAAETPVPRRQLHDSAVQVPGSSVQEAGTQISGSTRPQQVHAQSQTTPSVLADGATLRYPSQQGASLPQTLLSPPPQPRSEQGALSSAALEDVELPPGIAGALGLAQRLERDAARDKAVYAEREALALTLHQALLTLGDRLVAAQAAATAKLQQLSDQLQAPEAREPARRAVLLGAQRLLQMQYDAERAETERQMAALRADAARQQLQAHVRPVGGPEQAAMALMDRQSPARSPGVSPATRRPVAGPSSTAAHRLAAGSSPPSQTPLVQRTPPASVGRQGLTTGAGASPVDPSRTHLALHPGGGLPPMPPSGSSLRESGVDWPANVSEHFRAPPEQLDTYDDPYDEQLHGQEQEPGRRQQEEQEDGGYGQSQQGQGEDEEGQSVSQGMEYELDDGSRSELSALSADLEMRRHQLLAMVEEKKRELARRKRAEKFRAKQQQVAQLEQQLEAMDAILDQADGSESSHGGSAAGRSQTQHASQASGPSLEAHGRREPQRPPALGEGARRGDQQPAAPVVASPAPGVKQAASHMRLPAQRLAAGPAPGLGAASASVSEGRGSAVGAMHQGPDSVSAEEDDYLQRIQQLEREVEEKQKQARQLELLRKEEELKAKLRSLEASIAASASAIQHPPEEPWHEPPAALQQQQQLGMPASMQKTSALFAPSTGVVQQQYMPPQQQPRMSSSSQQHVPQFPPPQLQQQQQYLPPPHQLQHDRLPPQQQQQPQYVPYAQQHEPHQAPLPLPQHPPVQPQEQQQTGLHQALQQPAAHVRAPKVAAAPGPLRHQDQQPSVQAAAQDGSGIPSAAASVVVQGRPVAPTPTAQPLAPLVTPTEHHEPTGYDLPPLKPLLASLPIQPSSYPTSKAPVATPPVAAVAAPGTGAAVQSAPAPMQQLQQTRQATAPPAGECGHGVHHAVEPQSEESFSVEPEEVDVQDGWGKRKPSQQLSSSVVSEARQPPVAQYSSYSSGEEDLMAIQQQQQERRRRGGANGGQDGSSGGSTSSGGWVTRPAPGQASASPGSHPLQPADQPSSSSTSSELEDVRPAAPASQGSPFRGPASVPLPGASAQQHWHTTRRRSSGPEHDDEEEGRSIAGTGWMHGESTREGTAVNSLADADVLEEDILNLPGLHGSAGLSGTTSGRSSPRAPPSGEASSRSVSVPYSDVSHDAAAGGEEVVASRSGTGSERSAGPGARLDAHAPVHAAQRQGRPSEGDESFSAEPSGYSTVSAGGPGQGAGDQPPRSVGGEVIDVTAPPDEDEEEAHIHSDRSGAGTQQGRRSLGSETSQSEVVGELSGGIVREYSQASQGSEPPVAEPSQSEAGGGRTEGVVHELSQGSRLSQGTEPPAVEPSQSEVVEEFSQDIEYEPSQGSQGSQASRQAQPPVVEPSKSDAADDPSGYLGQVQAEPSGGEEDGSSGGDAAQPTVEPSGSDVAKERSSHSLPSEPSRGQKGRQPGSHAVVPASEPSRSEVAEEPSAYTAPSEAEQSGDFQAEASSYSLPADVDLGQSDEIISAEPEDQEDSPPQQTQPPIGVSHSSRYALGSDDDGSRTASIAQSVDSDDILEVEDRSLEYEEDLGEPVKSGSPPGSLSLRNGDEDLQAAQQSSTAVSGPGAVAHQASEETATLLQPPAAPSPSAVSPTAASTFHGDVASSPGASLSSPRWSLTGATSWRDLHKPGVNKPLFAASVEEEKSGALRASFTSAAAQLPAPELAVPTPLAVAKEESSGSSHGVEPPAEHSHRSLSSAELSQEPVGALPGREPSAAPSVYVTNSVSDVFGPVDDGRLVAAASEALTPEAELTEGVSEAVDPEEEGGEEEGTRARDQQGVELGGSGSERGRERSVEEQERDEEEQTSEGLEVAEEAAEEEAEVDDDALLAAYDLGSSGGDLEVMAAAFQTGDDDDEEYASDADLHDLKSSGEELAQITVMQADDDDEGTASDKASSSGGVQAAELEADKSQAPGDERSAGQESSVAQLQQEQQQQGKAAEPEEDAESVEDEEIPEEASQVSLPLLQQPDSEKSADQRDEATGVGLGRVVAAVQPVGDALHFATQAEECMAAGISKKNSSSSIAAPPHPFAQESSQRALDQENSAGLAAEPSKGSSVSSVERRSQMDLNAAIEATLASMGDDFEDEALPAAEGDLLRRSSILDLAPVDDLHDSLFSPTVGPRTSITSLKSFVQAPGEGAQAQGQEAAQAKPEKQRSGGSGASDEYDDEDFEAPVVEASGASAPSEQESEAARSARSGTSGEKGKPASGSSEEDLDLGEDVSIEFDEASIGNDLEISGTPEDDSEAAGQQQRPSTEDRADSVADTLAQYEVSDSVEAVVGADRTSSTPDTSASARPGNLAGPGAATGGSWAVRTPQYGSTSLGDSEDWESLAPPASKPAPPAPAAAPKADAKPAGHFRQYGPGRGDASSSSSGGSPANSIGEDDLGWGGDEGSLDDFELDVTSLVVPQHEQDVMRASTASTVAAAPGAPMSPTSIVNYVDSVVEGFLAAGPLPEILLPGQEPLSLEGYLALERALDPVASSEAQHIAHKALYDAVNEVLLGIYKAANRVQVPAWLKPDQVRRPLPEPKALAEEVRRQVLSWGELLVRSEADIERLLPLEAAEEEKTWGDIAEEEAELKLEVAELIWDELITELAEELAVLDRKMRRWRGAGRG